MSDVQIRGLMKVHNQNRRAATEQARELAHLRHRAYRGCENIATPETGEVHGTFCYRGRTYKK